MYATIKKWGNSQGMRFSKELLESIGLEVEDKVRIDVVDRKLVIYKAEPEELKLSDVFAKYKGDNGNGEFDWGRAKGDEKW